MAKKITVVVLAVLLLACVIVLLGSETVADSLAGVLARKPVISPNTQIVTGPDADMINDFLSEVNTSSVYNYSGTKQISGDTQNPPVNVNEKVSHALTKF